jgi:GNAT superfamily N-acetyltransferase
MSSIEIVQYEPSYAEGLAKMWNMSSGEWGGGASIRSMEQVLEEEEKSDALHVLLAICENEVAGYCSIGEFQEESGVLYVQWLNVRPDFHGQKVGKKLMQQAVEQAIAMGWPRIDLYTWGGNLKAVPLYKKCGFFWEDREHAVHFINFMPQVASSPALAPYFREYDWYGDLAREIEMKPDGVKDNGFETYTYLWEKNGKKLRVDFERKGHGICLIETEDYLLSAKAEQAAPLFGNFYNVEYRIVNKSGAPLHLDFKGESDEHIEFQWENALQVDGERAISARFYVNAIGEEQSDWRTYPGVRTRVTINGLDVFLKIGLATKFPANLTLNVPVAAHRLDCSYTMYLDIHNHLPQPATVSLQLPSLSWLEWGQREINIPLPAKEKVSLAVPYTLLDYGFYHEQLEVRLLAEDGRNISFTHHVHAGFGGPGAKFSGETAKGLVVRNGGCELHYNKVKNGIILIGVNGKSERMFLPAPLLGKPYSSEFARKQPLAVETIEEATGIGLRVSYRAEAVPELVFYTTILLYADGIAKLWHEWRNDSASPLTREVWVSQPIQASLYGLIASYRGRLLSNEGSSGSQSDAWDGSLFSEPWLFVRGGKTPVGMCWGPDYTIGFSDWHMELEGRISDVGVGEKQTLKPVYLSMGAFADWTSFREFAMAEPQTGRTPITVSPVELTVHDDNPFVSDESQEVKAALRDVKQMVWEGVVTASYRGTGDAPQAVSLKPEDGTAEASFSLPAPTASVEIADVHAKLNQEDKIYSSVLFRVSGNEVQFEEYEASANRILRASNGVLAISASPDYFPGLHSISVKGREWLASGFPHHNPKSWWNPWIGGFNSRIGGISAASLLKEKHAASSASIADDKGNIWSGIAVRQHILEHDKLKGITIDTFYLMLPGAPVLAIMTDIRQSTGSFLFETLSSEMCLHFGEAAEEATSGLGSGWIRTFDLNGRPVTYPIGKGEVVVRESRDYVFGSDGHNGLMYVVTQESENTPSIYGNPELCSLSFASPVRLPHGKGYRSAPIFLVFSDKLLPEGGLEALRKTLFPFNAKHQQWSESLVEMELKNENH